MSGGNNQTKHEEAKQYHVKYQGNSDVNSGFFINYLLFIIDTIFLL